MTSPEQLAVGLLGLLAETTLAASAAIVLVLLLRRPLRNAFGAGLAYVSWALVPVMGLAVLLPSRVVSEAPSDLWQAIPAVAKVDLPTQAAATFPATLLALVWALGALVALARVLREQRRFLAALGHLVARDDGSHQAEAVAGLPAALGLLRPRIVVPSDFDTRYSAAQRALMQIHERAHIRRGDLHVNAGVALLRCVFWFNPLVHLAARHFRHDQELACDQHVVARHPQQRRAYGEAMLHTQLAGQPLPLGCHWGFSHPLRERIEMLKQTKPSRARLAGGICLMLLLGAATGTIAWAAQPAGSATALQESTPQAAVVGDASSADTPEARLPAPTYPKQALSQRTSGKVVLLIDLDATGRPTHVEVAESEPAGVFDAATVETAYQWRFDPEIRDGKPVPSRVRVPVTFEPDKGEQTPASPSAST
jgi:TonB family protein